MNKEDFFTGKTEKYIISVLKERGSMTLLEIGGYYSDGRGKHIVKKLLNYDLIELLEEDKIKFLKWTGEKKE